MNCRCVSLPSATAVIGLGLQLLAENCVSSGKPLPSIVHVMVCPTMGVVQATELMTMASVVSPVVFSKLGDGGPPCIDSKRSRIFTHVSCLQVSGSLQVEGTFTSKLETPNKLEGREV